METKRRYFDLSKMKGELKAITGNLCQYKKEKKALNKKLSAAESLDDKGDVIRQIKDNYAEYGKLRYHYRHMHTAYCELRGRSRGEIEMFTPRAKALREDLIKNLKLQFTPETE